MAIKTEVTVPPSELRFLKGVGPKKVQVFDRLGIKTVPDLFYYFPRRYEDRSHFKTIAELQPGQITSVRGEILASKLKRIRRLQIVEVTLGDETGMIHAVWFNQPYLKKQFVQGEQIILFGKVEFYKNRLQMSSPEHERLVEDDESLHAGRITPIYPLTEGLFQRSLRMTLRHALETELDRCIKEYYPPAFLKTHHLMELPQAIRHMHLPDSFAAQEKARQRIVFDEFMLFECLLVRKMQRLKTKYQSHPINTSSDHFRQFSEVLPFELTAGQEQAMEDLRQDLEKKYPMNRLVQGDVGSGKTVVATYAMYLAAQSSMQSVLLAPTEILAEQHYRTVSALLKSLGVEARLLTASTPQPRRERILAELKTGKCLVLVGTHAVLSDDLSFKNLAVLVVDEQHKFGVHQRSKLLNSNPRPHQIVMTATPIPRTLAFTLYGDLAISSIKELPKGRQPIKTYWLSAKQRHKAFEHIKKKLDLGEQAFFVFPLIAETEKMDLLAAEKEYEELRETVFKKYNVGLVHGRMHRQERENVMDGFSRGEIDVLFATSVIEVGVDQPNATMMVIENAERFGLAQLHQMRGRIGRGTKASECYLFGNPNTEEGKARLHTMTRTQDGFQIAEEDLKIRGAGDFLGTRQSGVPYFHIADPVQDEKLLFRARDVAMQLVREGEFTSEVSWRFFKAHLERIALNY